MSLALKILLPVLILIGAVFAAKKISENKPEPFRRPQFSQAQAVDAQTLSESDYQVVVSTQGTVRPSREGALVPEITGTITSISPNLVVGGFFKSGELLVEIDQRDFEIALTQTEAGYAQASAVLQEERARSKQATADWNSLGRAGKPSALTIRAPQVAAARANLASAKAQIDKAKLDLDRTRIFAPYDGRVLEKNVDVGEFVNRGAALGRIHATDAVEVRLPLSNRQLTHIELPDGSGEKIVENNVTLSAEVGGRETTWQATLVRCEGVDTTSQQLHCVAQVNNPLTSGTQPLRIGQYVKAALNGTRLEKVFVIPRSALREDREVVLVDKESKFQIQPVTIAWADDVNAAVSEGLKTGDVLTTTGLGAVANGTAVRATIDGVAPPPPARGQGQGQGKGQGGSGKGNGAQSGKPGKQAGGRENSKTGNNKERPKPEPADGGTNAAAQQETTGESNPRARMQALKEIVDSGGTIPDSDKERIRERIASGGRVPPWLRAAVEK